MRVIGHEPVLKTLFEILPGLVIEKTPLLGAIKFTGSSNGYFLSIVVAPGAPGNWDVTLSLHKGTSQYGQVLSNIETQEIEDVREFFTHVRAHLLGELWALQRILGLEN